MSSYNKCVGCGLTLQSIEKHKEGYSPKKDAKYCMVCFRAKHYGESINNLFKVDAKKSLVRLKQQKTNVILVMDILNLKDTMVKNINKYIKPVNLYLVVNMSDLIPMSVSLRKLKNWVAREISVMEIRHNQIVISSALKNDSIDEIAKIITSTPGNFSIIGYSNVGKTLLLKRILKAKKIYIDSLDLSSIGTTKQPMEYKLKNKILTDYPGFYLEGNIQNYVDFEVTKKLIGKKEIKVINYQVNQGQTIFADDLFALEIVKQDNKSSFQFLMSNKIKVLRRKSCNVSVDESFIKHEIFLPKKTTKLLLIVSGLGTIFVKPDNNTLYLYLPLHVNFYTLSSYN